MRPRPSAQRLAYETRQVYAPLANRLGVWQLKWELEDWSFRYLEPDNYKRVAGWLASKRGDRERYIEDVIATLRDGARQGADRRRHRRPPETHLQHLAQDAAQGTVVRSAVRRARRARAGRDDRGLLRRARRRARPVAVHPGRVRRLHRDAEGQRLSLAAHGGDRPGQAAARNPDPHARDARARRAGRRRALALQGRRPRQSGLRAEDRLAAPAARARRARTKATAISSSACARRCSRIASMRCRRAAK